MGKLEAALAELERAKSISEELQDFSLDADIFGEMADTYADLGNYEKAAEVRVLCVVTRARSALLPTPTTWPFALTSPSVRDLEV